MRPALSAMRQRRPQPPHFSSADCVWVLENRLVQVRRNRMQRPLPLRLRTVMLGCLAWLSHVLVTAANKAARWSGALADKLVPTSGEPAAVIQRNALSEQLAQEQEL